MQKKLHGIRYDYLIVSNDNCFEIWATYKLTHQTSLITNLNYILSEFQIGSNSEQRFSESSWLLRNQNEIEAYWNKAVILFDNKNYLFLESALDEDRNVGGWNSDFKF
jgi:hypothetical protein